RARPAGRRQRSTELEPVLGRDAAGGDRHEAGEARLGGERVVVRRVEPPFGDVEADGKQLPFRREEKAELGFLDEVVGEGAEALEALDRFLRDLNRLSSRRGRAQVVGAVEEAASALDNVAQAQ